MLCEADIKCIKSYAANENKRRNAVSESPLFSRGIEHLSGAGITVNCETVSHYFRRGPKRPESCGGCMNRRFLKPNAEDYSSLHAWSADHVHYFPGSPTCGLIQLRISPTVASQRQYYTILINESAKHVWILCAPMRSMCPSAVKQ
jgi:hypothetical protein